MIIFIAECPRAYGQKALRLVFWNADGVRGRKMEHGVDVCLLKETQIEPSSRGKCSDPCRQGHRSLPCASLGSATPGGHCHLPVAGNQESEAYFSPTWPWIESALTECVAGGI